MVISMLLATTVIVHASVPREVNGVGDVQAIFNGNFNGNGRGSGDAELAPLALNGARAFFLVNGNPNWRKAESGLEAKLGRKPTPDEVCEAWSAQDFRETLPAEIGRPTTTQQWQLRYFPNSGITNDIAFHVDLTPALVKHPGKSREIMGETLQAIRRTAPYLGRDLYWFFANEPNYPNWTWYYKSIDDAVSGWIRQYDNLAEWEEKGGVEGFRQIGPCIASASFFSWTGYDKWVLRPLAEVCHPLDIFQYHVYYIGADWHFAWFSMLQSDAERLGRPRPRSFVTEANHCLWWEGWGGERCRWFADQLMMELANPDKFMFFSIHMAIHRWCSDLLVQDGKNPDGSSRWKLSEVGELFRAFAPVRGKAFDCTSDDPSLKAFAARPDARTLVLALWNRGDGRSAKLDIRGLKGNVTGVETRSLRVLGDGEVSCTNSFGTAVGSVEIKRDELKVLVFRCDTETSYEKPLGSRDYYVTDLTRRFVARPLRTAFTLAKPPVAGERAYLRLGVQCNDGLYARGFAVKVNGKSFPVRYSATRRNLFEFPLDGVTLGADNDLEIADVDSPLTVLFASVVLREEKVPLPACVPDGISASAVGGGNCIVGARVFDGDDADVVVRVENNGTSPVRGALDVAYPKEFSGPSSVPFALKPDCVQRLRLRVKACATGDFGTKEIRIAVRTPEREPILLRPTFRVETSHAVVRSDALDWNRAAPALCSKSGSKTSFLWSSKGLAFRSVLSEADAARFRKEGLRVSVDYSDKRDKDWISPANRVSTKHDFRISSKGTVDVVRWAPGRFGKTEQVSFPAGKFLEISTGSGDGSDAGLDLESDEEDANTGSGPIVLTGILLWNRTDKRGVIPRPFVGLPIALDLRFGDGLSLLDGVRRDLAPAALPTFRLQSSENP